MSLNFDQATAALGAAIIAAIVAVVNILVSIKTSRQQAQLGVNLGIIKDIFQERRNRTYSQLSQFYDPLVTLLSVNKNIFERIGPKSDARKSELFPDEETAGVWNQLVESVISPNNEKICNIIAGKLHLIYEKDSIEPYLEFTTHAHAYRIFRKEAYEAYRLFPFPKDFLEHVIHCRKKLMSEMEKYMDNINLTEGEYRGSYSCIDKV